MGLASLCLDSPSAVLLAQTQIVWPVPDTSTPQSPQSPLCLVTILGSLPHTPAEILLHALDPGTWAWSQCLPGPFLLKAL